MNPGRVIEWEPVLRSQVAVSLLLLGALFGVLAWCWMLYRENQRLNRWIRDHLQAEGDFRTVLEHVREAMTLNAGGDA